MSSSLILHVPVCATLTDPSGYSNCNVTSEFDSPGSHVKLIKMPMVIPVSGDIPHSG